MVAFLDADEHLSRPVWKILEDYVSKNFGWEARVELADDDETLQRRYLINLRLEPSTAKLVSPLKRRVMNQKWNEFDDSECTYKANKRPRPLMKSRERNESATHSVARCTMERRYYSLLSTP